MMNPLIPDTCISIAENLTSALVNDEIGNPYLAGALAPLVGTFVRTILAQAAHPPFQPPRDAAERPFLELATRHYPEERS